MRVCTICFLLLYGTATVKLFCQSTTPVISSGINEKIRIRTDRNFYIAGERIWFRIFLTDGSEKSSQGFSRVAYVEMLDNRNEVILKQKVKTDPSGGTGYLDIPVDISSGYYFVRSYTNWMKNSNPGGYFISAVAILNPAGRLYQYEDTVESSEETGSNGMTEENYMDSILYEKQDYYPGIVFTGLKKEYSRRERVELEINATDPAGGPVASDISVSVYYSGDKEFHAPEIETHAGSDPNMDPGISIKSKDHDGPTYIPELEGVTICGRIMDISGQNALGGLPVVMSVTGESSFLKSYLSGADGRFYFSLNDLYGEKEIVLFCDYPSDDLQIVIDGPFSQDFTGLPDQGFRLDDSWRSFIEKQMINHQLSSLYNSRRDSLITSKKEAAKPFYTQPDLTIRMENYILLPNMEEVFRELVKQVLVTRQEGRLALNVLDYNTNRIIGPKPAFFIDGVPFFDPAVIFEMDPESIEEINIVSHKYYKGILEMDGIVDIRTKQGDLPISEMPANYLRYPFQGYQQILGYNGPDYSDEQKLKSRIPDFRNLLYWDPSVKTGSDGKAYISFFTSDNTGRYTISLEGISPDGLFTSVSCSFMVTK